MMEATRKMASDASRLQKEKEKKAFQAFLAAHPALAASLRPGDAQEEPGAFPDVVARLTDGQEIGFELGEWLNEDQTRRSKKGNQFALAVGTAIKQQSQITTRHIHSVLLTPKNDHQQFDQRDGEKLGEELFRLIQETDQQWPSEPHWQSPQGYHYQKLAAFPTLTKYLDEVWFVPRVAGKVTKDPRRPGIPLIDVEGEGGAYSGEPARDALRAILLKKAGKYSPYSEQTVYLLIHYGVDGEAYTTPFQDYSTPDFEAVARFASEVVKSCNQAQRLPFEKVYLCNTLPFELEAYEIFPSLSRVE